MRSRTETHKFKMDAAAVDALGALAASEGTSVQKLMEEGLREVFEARGMKAPDFGK